MEAIIATMDQFLAYARNNQKSIGGLIRRMVECESPTGDETAIARMADLMIEEPIYTSARST